MTGEHVEDLRHRLNSRKKREPILDRSTASFVSWLTLSTKNDWKGDWGVWWSAWRKINKKSIIFNDNPIQRDQSLLSTFLAKRTFFIWNLLKISWILCLRLIYQNLCFPLFWLFVLFVFCFKTLKSINKIVVNRYLPINNIIILFIITDEL